MKGYESYAVGRRKTSVARVYVKAGEGDLLVNGKSYQEYFGRSTLQMIARQALVVLGKLSDYSIKINVCGGGKSGQAAACRHGIARALDQIGEEDFHKSLKTAGLLTRDAREVERKKYGRHKARKRPQYSKR